MRTSQFQHRNADGQVLHVHRWLPDEAQGAPRAALLVVHGMAEHGARYARLAQALTAERCAVYALDLPGHGRTAPSARELGHFADWNGWQHALAAIHGVRKHVAGEHHGLPLFLLGHSMGSFLLQTYLPDHGEGLAGVVLSGTHGDLGPLRAIGLALISLEALVLGRRHPSAIGEAASFKAYARRIKPRRTDFDWLSRDPAEVDAYIGDPFCGFRCTAALWTDLMRACARLVAPEALARVPKALPVLLIAGAEDPVSAGAAGPALVERAYTAAGLKDVSVRIYEGARHELLNETCREQVTADLVEWLVNHLPARRS